MKPVDYLRLLEPDHFSGVLGGGSASVQELYGDRAGVSYRYDQGMSQLTQEVVWVERDLMLLFGSVSHQTEATQHQVVSDGDWVHVQFQARGASEEKLPDGSRMRATAGSCIITRYPAGLAIERKTRATPEWRAACLYFRPTVLRDQLGASSALLSEGLGWLLDGSEREVQSREFAVGSRAQLAINDLFTCRFTSAIRKSYMRAKALELLTLAVNHVVEDGDTTSAPALTDDDRARISAVRQILADEIESQLTLEQLARRVNLNRSKLAMGFKLMYGESLQAHWRRMRLSRARELLAVNQWSVTEVAAAVGYADTSSLTRAFERHFGVLPKDCRPRRGDGAASARPQHV